MPILIKFLLFSSHDQKIENEYGNVIGSYGNDGKEYVQWCASLAESYQIGVPWVMCQESDAPSPMVYNIVHYFLREYYVYFVNFLILFTFCTDQYLQWLVL
jgi:hypothetical protein